MYKPDLAGTISVLLLKPFLLKKHDNKNKHELKTNPQVCVSGLEYAFETTVCNSRIVKTFKFFTIR